ncbi:hypothetical protein AVEN_223437-1 [Araneus ventricosus]|uniref:Mos1 transposase HTH domain-containing protein n=1 Tax=Araneus ventricosus TaxID=182803 RepID=A0A4Y2ESF2_ARAVE|nr:hypothetical protein AVEN_223437-1 [Araneus ventricosus]
MRFLNARNMLTDDIHRQICDKYGEQIRGASVVRRWKRQFKERNNVHDKRRSGKPPVVADGAVHVVEEKVKTQDSLQTLTGKYSLLLVRAQKLSPRFSSLFASPLLLFDLFCNLRFLLEVPG